MTWLPLTQMGLCAQGTLVSHMASIQDLISNIKAVQIMCKDCREYIVIFVACFGHQSCFRWRRLAGRHWLRNRPFALVNVWVNNNRNPVSVTPLHVIMSKKRNALTLRHKVALINEQEADNSCRQLADQFNIRRTQATSFNKRKVDLLLEYDQNNCLDGKRKLQMTGNEDVSIICWEWFQINKPSYERHGLE